MGVIGEQRCNTCKYIRDLELFEYGNAYECQMCTRKRDRVRLGMVTYGNSRIGGVKSAAQRKKIEQAIADQSFKDWKEHRKAQLRKNGIAEWDLYRYISHEQDAIKERFGLD